MHIDYAIEQSEGLVSFLENFRVNGFESAINVTKTIALKCVIHRKRKFDENQNHTILLPEESFRIEYFLYIVDQAISSIKEAFLKHNSMSDIDEIEIPIDILNHIKVIDSYPNTCICYRIIFTIPITVASAERKILSGLTILSIEKKNC
ncbi:hypothetical protein ABFS83_02G096300 [Erythranthe nasuta]